MISFDYFQPEAIGAVHRVGRQGAAPPLLFLKGDAILLLVPKFSGV